MKAGKREDMLFFIIQTVSLLPSYKDSFFGHRDIPYSLFQKAGDATVKRNNIKEDIQ
jgi:hypothetical protein